MVFRVFLVYFRKRSNVRSIVYIFSFFFVRRRFSVFESLFCNFF